MTEEFWMPRTKPGKELADVMRLWFTHVDGLDEDAWTHWVGMIREAEDAGRAPTEDFGIDCQGDCGASFETWDELKKHLELFPDLKGDGFQYSRAHINDGYCMRVWQCPRCEVLFFHDDPLSDHMYEHRVNEDDPFDGYNV